MHPITWRKSRLRLKTYKSHPRSVVGATSTELLGLSSIFLYLTPWMMDCSQLYISHNPTRRDKTVASSRRVWWCEFATRGAKLAVVVWLYLCRQMCFVAGHTEDLSRDISIWLLMTLHPCLDYEVVSCWNRTTSLLFIDTYRLVCGTGSMKRSGVRPFVRLSVPLSLPSFDCSSGVRQICWAPRRQEILIDRGGRRALSSKCGQCHVDSRVV